MEHKSAEKNRRDDDSLNRSNRSIRDLNESELWTYTMNMLQRVPHADLHIELGGWEVKPIRKPGFFSTSIQQTPSVEIGKAKIVYRV